MNTFIPSPNPSKRRPSLKFIKLLKLTPIPLAAILVLIITVRVIGKKPASQPENNSAANAQVAGALATTQINKQFLLPIKNGSEELGKLNVEVLSAEKRNEIYVKGQKATAIAGRQFLIINLKISNGLDRNLDVNTRNYIRLSVNGNENEWLAPDIHNDPVEVQAISTKHTRVGFPINDSDSLLMLQVGEVKGDKEKILLEF